MPDDGRIKPETLMRMATFYLARHSASAERVRAVLARKIERRFVKMDETPPEREAVRAMIEPVIERLLRTGLLNDAVFARGRAASLLAKGRPAWRVRAELAQAGVEPDLEEVSDLLGTVDPVVQATVWARRRRLGPYRLRDRAAHRERDVASLARAGFPVSIAKAVIDQPDETDGSSDV